MSEYKSIQSLSSELTDSQEAVSNLQQYDDAQREFQLAEEEELEKQAGLRKDPHGLKDASEFGLGENITELRNAIVGGIRDTASSIATAPERFYDMATGEMQE